MKLDEFGYKFLMTTFSGPAPDQGACVSVEWDDAFHQFCNLMILGKPIGVLMYRHGNMGGAAEITEDIYQRIGAQAAWDRILKDCGI